MKKLFRIKNINKGFTLIELIVVVGIIAVISTLSLFNSSGLNSSVLLSNTAYEIGLIVRDAQISGLGAKVMLDGSVATTSNQGVYFNTFEPEKIIFFADVNGSNSYGEGEESQVYNIENKRAGKILSICKISFGAASCSSSNILDLNVVINLGFDQGECKSIIIYKTGAIQIDKSYCPQP